MRSEAAALGASAALQGLQLIARNYRCKAGEIDLVMLDGADAGADRSPLSRQRSAMAAQPPRSHGASSAALPLPRGTCC